MTSQRLSEPSALCALRLRRSRRLRDEALKLAARYGYRIYDALILAAAIETGCDVLYSEDMQDGQHIGALTIRNPFPAHRRGWRFSAIGLGWPMSWDDIARLSGPSALCAPVAPLTVKAS